jgi:hypothetical protein
MICSQEKFIKIYADIQNISARYIKELLVGVQSDPSKLPCSVAKIY